MGRLGWAISKAILAQTSLVSSSVHIASDHRYSFVCHRASCSIVDMMRLSAAEHQTVLAMGLDYQKGDEGTKQVYIRDQLDSIFTRFFIKMRLLSHEVGIHPGNRDDDVITPIGCWTRGARVVASGFSHTAIGKLWAFEDHPVKKHIAKHTVEATKVPSSATLTSTQ